jgi:hypothetical protein
MNRPITPPLIPNYFSRDAICSAANFYVKLYFYKKGGMLRRISKAYHLKKEDGMKKCDYKKLAMLGLASGSFLLTAGCQSDAEEQKSGTEMQQQHRLTEADLLNLLDSDTKQIYQGLDAEGKALALKLANQSCKGQNSCKGMNSCKSSTNSCAGLGSCKGTTVGPFKDKNSAVKVAAKAMEKKRSEMNK